MIYEHKGYTLIHRKFEKDHIITDNCGNAWRSNLPIAIGGEMSEDEAERYIDTFLSMQDWGITNSYQKLDCVLNTDDRQVYRMPGNSSWSVEIKKRDN